MKRSRLSYDEWKCIEKKQIHGKRVMINGFEGYISLRLIQLLSDIKKFISYTHICLNEIMGV